MMGSCEMKNILYFYIFMSHIFFYKGSELGMANGVIYMYKEWFSKFYNILQIFGFMLSVMLVLLRKVEYKSYRHVL